MTPVINPLVIYLIEICDTVLNIIQLLIFINIVAFLMYLYVYNEHILFRNSTGDISYLARNKLAIYEAATTLKNTLDREVNSIESIVSLEDKDEEFKRLSLHVDDCCSTFHNLIRKIEQVSAHIEENIKLLDKSKYRIAQLSLIFLGLIIFYILIPSTETGYAMLIASYTTPDNLHISSDASKEYIEWAIQVLINNLHQLKQ